MTKEVIYDIITSRHGLFGLNTEIYCDGNLCGSAGEGGLLGPQWMAEYAKNISEIHKDLMASNNNIGNLEVAITIRE